MINARSIFGYCLSLILIFSTHVMAEPENADASKKVYYAESSANQVAFKSDSLPKGASGFIAEAPRNQGGEVVSVADFGGLPSNADNVSAFQSAIDYCKRKKAAKLIVPTGVYHFTSSGPLQFVGFSDFTFDGQDSDFVFHDAKRAMMKISESERAVFKNFHIDWEWEKDPLASVVKIKAVDPAFKFMDIEFVDYEKFPKRDVVIAFLRGTNLQTRSPGTEGGLMSRYDAWGEKPKKAKYEWLSDNTLRLYSYQNDSLLNAKEGDYVRVSHYYYQKVGMYLNSNKDFSLDNCIIYSCPGMGYYIDGENERLQFLKVKIARRPNSKRPITCTADHFFVAGVSTNGMLLDGCEFSFGGDDAINIHAKSAVGQRVSDHEIALHMPVDVALISRAGDKMEIRNQDGSPTGAILALKEVKNTKDNQWTFVFDETLPAQSGDVFWFFNQRNAIRNVIIRNSSFHDAGRVLILCKDVTFENNTLSHTGWLRVESGYLKNAWAEGQGTSNIVIKNNLFDWINVRNSRPQEWYPGGISVGALMRSEFDTTEYRMHENILIEGNTIIDPPGPAIYVSSASHVTVLNNKISANLPRIVQRPYCGSILIEKASDVTVVNNTWKESKLIQNPGVVVDTKNTENIVCKASKLDGKDAKATVSQSVK